MFGAGCFFNAVRVVEQYAEIANTPDAGFRTNGRLTGLNARITEDAFFGFAAFPVEVDFFVRAAADAQAPAAAFILIDQHNAVFFTLVNGTARAGGDTAWVQAVFAQARQIHHEGVFKLAVHLLLDLVEVAVAGAFFKFAAEQLFPVRSPDNFIHPLAVNQRTGTSGGHMLPFRRAVQMLIVVGERLIVIIDLRNDRVSEDFGDDAHFAAQTRSDLAIHVANPTALPLLLIFPVFRIADAGFRLDVVKPRVLHSFTPGPDVFTGDGAGVAANTFIKVQYHANL